MDDLRSQGRPTRISGSLELDLSKVVDATSERVLDTLKRMHMDTMEAILTPITAALAELNKKMDQVVPVVPAHEAKTCEPVPCPPFQDIRLEVSDTPHERKSPARAAFGDEWTERTVEDYRRRLQGAVDAANEATAQ